ncbi:MAG: hypothetical protein AAF934_00800 [Bacteroidota bacterium]
MRDLINCPTCKTGYETQPDKCNKCRYPFSGTAKEKSHFVAHQIMKKEKISDTKNSIKNTRTILFAIAGFNIVIPFFKFSNAQYGGLMIAMSVCIGLIFLIFGFTAKKKPFISILIPLILLILFYVLDAIIEPTTLFQGIVWKIVFVGSMIYSLVSIVESEKIKKESEHLAAKDYK